MKKISVILLILLFLSYLSISGKVSAYSQITLQDYEPQQVHRCYGISQDGMVNILSNTASNLLKVKAWYYGGYYTFVHDEWNSVVYDIGYTDPNFSFGDHTEYHYQSSEENIYNRYPLPGMYQGGILLCASQADIDISYPTGGYIEGFVTGRFYPLPPGFSPFTSTYFTETATINF